METVLSDSLLKIVVRLLELGSITTLDAKNIGVDKETNLRIMKRLVSWHIASRHRIKVEKKVGRPHYVWTLEQEREEVVRILTEQLDIETKAKEAELLRRRQQMEDVLSGLSCVSSVRP